VRVNDAAAPSPVAAGESKGVRKSPEARDSPLAATPAIDDATPVATGATSTPQSARPGRPRVPEDSFWSFG
jgi:hypothetical protein